MPPSSRSLRETLFVAAWALVLLVAGSIAVAIPNDDRRIKDATTLQALGCQESDQPCVTGQQWDDPPADLDPADLTHWRATHFHGQPVYYLDVLHGNDSNGGTTPTTAWGTYAGAMAMLPAHAVLSQYPGTSWMYHRDAPPCLEWLTFVYGHPLVFVPGETLYACSIATETPQPGEPTATVTVAASTTPTPVVPTVTGTPTDTTTATATQTTAPSPTSTPTASESPTVTTTASATPTPTPTPTPTTTTTATTSPTSTDTPVPTATPTATTVSLPSRREAIQTVVAALRTAIASR